MDSHGAPIAGIVVLAAGALVLLIVLFFLLRFVWRIIAYVIRHWRARQHAIRSIPLPRHSALISGKPSTQIEAVLLDVFDTEYRRTIDGKPRYERYSAEEIAELRVFLFGRAFARKAPRILYETEVGVPLHRKFEQGDPAVCAWALKRLKADPPLFGKPDTIDDLVLKPGRFRRFLWSHGVGASAVLFLEDLFRALPITIVPRSLRSVDSPTTAGTDEAQLPASNERPADTGAGSGNGNEQRPTANDPSDDTGDARDGTEQLPVTNPRADVTGNGGDGDEDVRDDIGTLEDRVLKALETDDHAEVQGSIADARAAVLKASPEPQPEAVRALLDRLDVYEERLGSFEAAFAAETSRPMDDWAPWVREALEAATAGGNLAELGEDAVLERFKRHARRLWVTSSVGVTGNREASTAIDDAQVDEDDKPTTQASDEAFDDPLASPGTSSEHNTDKGSEIGF